VHISATPPSLEVISPLALLLCLCLSFLKSRQIPPLPPVDELALRPPVVHLRYVTHPHFFHLQVPIVIRLVPTTKGSFFFSLLSFFLSTICLNSVHLEPLFCQLLSFFFLSYDRSTHCTPSSLSSLFFSYSSSPPLIFKSSSLFPIPPEISM